jgi:hypothetical protein
MARANVGPRLAIAARMTIAIVLGRWLAWSVHPRAAWIRLGPGGRAALLGTYFAAGYIATLALLVAA